MPTVPPFLFGQAGSFPAPYTYSVPGSGEVQPYTATATYDGTNAAGNFLPALRFKSAEGTLLALVFPSTSITAGDSSEVTFVPPFGSAASSATPAASAILSWCVAESGTKTVTSGAGSSVTFDFTGALQTNDSTTYTLVTQGSGNATPSLNSAGIYLIYMVAQGTLSGAIVANTGLKISTSIYGNEPIGNPAVGMWYTDPVTGTVQAKATWLWILDLGGSGSSPPFSGDIGVRQNGGSNASVSVNFAAVRIDTAGDSIV